MLDAPSVRITQISKYEEDIASRQKLIPRWRQEKLQRSSVLVIGAGALGNEVVKNLVLIGVGTIYVVDFDLVELSNLNRCIFFRRKDVKEKKSKVKAIAEKASELSPYPHTRVIPLEANIHDIPYDHEMYTESEVYVSCLDNLAARLEVNAAALFNKKFLVNGGMNGFLGYVQVVIPYQTACLQCDVRSEELQTMYQRLSCSGTPLDLSGPKIPALPTTTSIIGGILAQETVKILLGAEQFIANGRWPRETGEPLAGKRLYMNTALNVYGVYEIERNPKCPACSTLSEQEKRIAAEWGREEGGDNAEQGR
ncbi:MAG: ThiF family adenylyltransferase [Desulfurococcaceae archaeon]